MRLRRRLDLRGQVPTRLALARRYLYQATPVDRRSTSMALSVAMRAVATFTLLLALVLPAAAQPLRPALKQPQCPVGSMHSGGHCPPPLRNTPPSPEEPGSGPRHR